MTERKIKSAIKRAQHAGNEGYYLEALLRMYHLNVNILRFIAVKWNVADADNLKKPLQIIEQMIANAEHHTELKPILAKRNLKSLRPWFAKMELFFKTLKRKEPNNTRALLSESEQVLTLLKIAVTKLFINTA